LTGHETKHLSLHHGQAKTEREQLALLHEVREVLTEVAKDRRLACCGTGRTKLPPGIANNHDYAILGYHPQTNLVEIWNPWGNQFKPKGEAGREHGYPTEGGTFSMPLRDFVRVFGSIYYETGRPGPARKGVDQ